MLQCVSTQIANGLEGEVKNRFSRWWVLWPSWISNQVDLSYFSSTSQRVPTPKFQLNSPCGLPEDVQNCFQNDGCGGHLGFLINTILAHFDPEGIMLLQSKFQLKSTKGLGRDVENWFSIGSGLAILCLLGAPMLLIKFQLNWIIVFIGDAQNMNSQHFSPC